MDRKLAWVAILVFMGVALFEMQAIQSVQAETKIATTSERPSLPVEPIVPEHFVNANGTVFQITNSSFLNVTLTSSEFVQVFLESGPRVVSYGIESLSYATSTSLTLSGFLPNTTYYRYQDSNLTESFATDSFGAYSYVQDISTRHHIFIVEHISTVYIQPDGSIYPATAPIRRDGDIYTLSADIYENVVVQRNNIIIDGNRHTLQGPGYGFGLLLLGRNNVTVRNIKITEFWLGIYLWLTNNSRVENITVTKMQGISPPARGIVLYGSHGNTILGNNATDNDWGGIHLYSSNNNSVLGNLAANNLYMGIWMTYSTGNTVSHNTAINNGRIGIGASHSFANIISSNNITNNGHIFSMGGIWLIWLGDNIVSGNNVTDNYCGIIVWASNDNTIYHNNFISNVYQVDSWASVNTWDEGYPSGGNYWSDYTGIDLYSGPDQNQPGKDGIGDNYYTNWAIVDRYPFMRETGWKKHYLTVQTEPAGIITISGEGWYALSTDVTLEAPAKVPVSTGIQYRFDQWTVDDSVVSGNPITVHIDANHKATAHYIIQYYLTVISDYDMAGGEGWYDQSETAYAILAVGLEYVDGLAYGFVGWSGDATGWDLISEGVIMDAPKTATANWEASEVYGDARTIGFWKHQVNVWYFTELKNSGIKIRGIGTAQISHEEIIFHLIFIDSNSDYFRGRIVQDKNGDGTVASLEMLENAYNILKTPRGLDSMKMRAEQQLLSVWLNLAHEAFFWESQLSQETDYSYYEYGLTDIGEAILFCEAELLKPDGNCEAAKDICDNINNNLGIIWGT